MKKRNILYISLGILVVIGLIWSFIAGKIITKNFKKEVLTNATERQEVTVHGLIVTETKDNKKYWEIYAEEGNYNNKDKVVLLNNVYGNFYQNDKVVMSFRANKGTLTEETLKVVLYEKAVIVYENGEYIVADRITWEGQDEEIEAQGKVLIEKVNQIRLKGERATLSPDWSKFKIMGRVKTELFGGEGKKL